MLMATRALQEAVPGYDVRWPARGLALGLVSLTVVLWFRQPMHGHVTVTQFIATGVGCAARTVLLASLPWCALLIGVRLGAPLAPARAGALAGGAAFLMAALLMRLVCPLHERLHLLVLHGLPVARGASAFAGVSPLFVCPARARPPPARFPR